MLVEFRVKNFRSFREEQCLSFCAASKDQETDLTHCIDTGNAKTPKLLRSSVIYGVNASGKSNLLYALEIMRKLVISPHLLSSPYSSYRRKIYDPFKLDSQSDQEPTKLEVVLLIEGTRYQYGFEFNNEHICGEWLLVHPQKGRVQRWFEYHYNAETKINDWEPFSIHFKSEERHQRETWKANTSEQSLFLTQATQLNSLLLKPIYNWFRNSKLIQTREGHERTSHNTMMRYTIRRIQEDEKYQRLAIDLAKIADNSINNIHVSSTQAVEWVDGKPEVYGTDFKMKIAHNMIGGEQIWLDKNDESHGTQCLLCYSSLLLDSILNGGLLVIDEFDSGLHPLLARYILQEIIHNPNIASKAQLLISTHDTSLLHPQVFRRDQIWFTEKKKQEPSTELYSLAEFKQKNKCVCSARLSARSLWCYSIFYAISLCCKQIKMAKNHKNLVRPIVQTKRQNINQREQRATVLIVCEGRCTEPNYLYSLKQCLGIDQNMVIRKGTTATDIDSLIQREKGLFQDDPCDYVFMILDDDRDIIQKQLQFSKKKLVLQQPNSKEKLKRIAIKPIFSVPCFEFWLLLHLQYSDAPFKNCQGVENELNKAMLKALSIQKQKASKTAHQKNDIEIFEKLGGEGSFERAIENAEKLRKSLKNSQLRSPSTDMDILVKDLRKIFPEAQKNATKKIYR